MCEVVCPICGKPVRGFIHFFNHGIKSKQELIEKYGITNIPSCGGGKIGIKLSEETKKKISESVKKAWKDPAKRKNLLKLCKAGGSAAAKRWEEDEGLREEHLKKVRSPENRKKISEAIKRKWQDPEFRKKQIKARKGKPAWNKGLTREKDPLRWATWARKISEATKRYFQEHPEARYRIAEIGKKIGKRIIHQIRLKSPAANTRPERILKSLLDLRGIQYKKNYILDGMEIDFLIEDKLAVFVDGCYWHMCPIHYQREPTPLLLKIKKRDEEVNRRLKEKGLEVIRVWEHEIYENIEEVLEKIESALKRLKK